jgi:hypothetical protein
LQTVRCFWKGSTITDRARAAHRLCQRMPSDAACTNTSCSNSAVEGYIIFVVRVCHSGAVSSSNRKPNQTGLNNLEIHCIRKRKSRGRIGFGLVDMNRPWLGGRSRFFPQLCSPVQSQLHPKVDFPLGYKVASRCNQSYISPCSHPTGERARKNVASKTLFMSH